VSLLQKGCDNIEKPFWVAIRLGLQNGFHMTKEPKVRGYQISAERPVRDMGDFSFSEKLFLDL
jgi:hypothetical protein